MFKSIRFIIIVVLLAAPFAALKTADAYGGERIRYTGGLSFGGCADSQVDRANSSAIPLQLSGLNTRQDYTIEMSITSKNSGRRFMYYAKTQKPGRSDFTFWLATFGNEKKLNVGKGDSLVFELYLRAADGSTLAGGAGELDCKTGALSGPLFAQG